MCQQPRTDELCAGIASSAQLIASGGTISCRVSRCAGPTRQYSLFSCSGCGGSSRLV